MCRPAPRPHARRMDILMDLFGGFGVGFGAAGALLLVAGVLLALVDDEAAA